MTSAWKEGSSGKERERRVPLRLGAEVEEDSLTVGCSCNWG